MSADLQRYRRPPGDEVPSRRALLRDVIIFQGKLWMDGLKDLVLAPLSVGAAVVDVMSGRPVLFYAVLRAGERFDRWLNLFSAADRAGRSREGLFAGSEPGDGTLLGELEELTIGKRQRREEPLPGVKRS